MSGNINGQAHSRFDFGQISPFKYFFGITFILGLLFAFISNQEDGIRPFYQILIQWQLQTVLPMALLIFSHMLLSRSQRFEHINPWVQLIISGVVGVLLFSPIALLLDGLFGVDAIDHETWWPLMQEEVLGVGPPVLLSWVAMNAPWLMGYRINHQMPETDTSTVSSDHPAFIQQLPEDIRGEVMYLKAELHYIEVTTTLGQALVLYNLKDAMHEIGSNTGMQTHRSYWVNLKYSERLVKQGRQGVMLMSDGESIPVSRTRLSAVQAACAELAQAVN